MWESGIPFIQTDFSSKSRKAERFLRRSLPSTSVCASQVALPIHTFWVIKEKEKKQNRFFLYNSVIVFLYCTTLTDSTNHVQILTLDVYVSFRANALRNGMHPSLLQLDIGKITEKIKPSSFGLATSLGEGRTLIQKTRRYARKNLCHSSALFF